MEDNNKLISDLLSLVHGGSVSKTNIYKLVFVGYLVRKYDIPMNCEFDNHLTFIQYIKEEISKLSYSKDEMNLLNQCLTCLVNDFNLSPMGIKHVVRFINNYPRESYLEFIRLDLRNNFDKFNTDIPEELARLVLRILNTKKGGNVADLICGNGNFLNFACEESSNISVLGLTKNKESLLNTELRLYMLNSDYQVDYESDAIIKELFGKYDSIFCLLPPDEKNKDIYYNNFINTKYNSVLWKYIDNAISMLNTKGKAVFILRNAPLFRNTDLEYRKYLIDNKLVEAIIELPSNILYNTGINTTMLILSKNRNSMINIIDATDMILENNKLDIDKIYNSYINNDNKITDVSIKDKNYSFIPSNYLNEVSKSMNNPVKLKDYIDIYRGYRGKIEINNKETIKLIQVGNLNADFIDINDLDDVSYNITMNKDLLKDGDIVFSRSANNFKCKMVHLKEGEKVIASENIFILRIKDKEVLSSYYLEEYLNSDIGKKSIFVNQIKSNVSMFQIGILKETYIDLIPKNRQLEIEKLSINKYEEMIKSRNKINDINKKINGILKKL